jgi:hypothetical protein
MAPAVLEHPSFCVYVCHGCGHTSWVQKCRWQDGAEKVNDLRESVRILILNVTWNVGALTSLLRDICHSLVYFWYTPVKGLKIIMSQTLIKQT